MHLDLADALKILVPIIVAQLLMHYQNRKDARVRDAKQEVIAVEYPAHRHDDEEGQPLHEHQLHYPKSRVNGSGR